MNETPELGTKGTCKNCKREIVYTNGILNTTWKHAANLLQICTPWKTDYAEPEM